MIKLETAINPDLMRSITYIWIPGMKWQVPEEEDSTILKAEVFGEELKFAILAEIPDCEIVRTEKGFVAERVWYGERARDVCRTMRKFLSES